MACPVRSGFKEVLPHSECSSVLWTIGGAGCGTPGEVIFGRLLYLLHCTATAPTWNGDKKISKWGPNGDFISSEMGTKSEAPQANFFLRISAKILPQKARNHDICDKKNA